MATPVSLLEFVATSSFGPATPGMMPPDLEAIFGPPEATGGQSRRKRWPSIWKYGDVEFYFLARPDGLYRIHLDRFSGPGRKPMGWGGLRLQPWCVREGLPLKEFLIAADAAKLTWCVREEPQFERVVVSFALGVEVGFDPEDGLFGLWWPAESRVGKT